MRKDKQSEISTDDGIHYDEPSTWASKFQRRKKSLLNIAVCSFGLFLFWIMIGEIGFAMFYHKAISFHETKEFFEPDPKYLPSLFAFITTSLSVVVFYTYSKIRRYSSNFPLVKLFSKSSLKKTKLKSLKSMRKKS
ncbi:MAG: hypothetical protein EBT45_04240 [Alphaproteobacteria bacterium]|jgi:hypothetical protein|nr:hypothetical protein [Alphaproteobacteria bacterium]